MSTTPPVKVSVQIGTPVWVREDPRPHQVPPTEELELSRWRRYTVVGDTRVSWIVGTTSGAEVVKVAKNNLQVRQPPHDGCGYPATMYVAWSEEEITAAWKDAYYVDRYATAIADRVRYSDAATLRKVAALVGYPHT